MKITQNANINPDLLRWNNQMHQKHPIPYYGIVGIIMRARILTVLKFAQITPTDTVLELGCASGRLLIEAPPAKRMVGVDISQTVLEDAAKLFADQNRRAEFFQLDAQQPLPFKHGEFSVIICSEMLEHVHNPMAVLKNIHAISTDNTRIVISTPMEAPKLFAKKILNTFGLFSLLFPGVEKGRSEWHIQYFSPKIFRSMIQDLFEIKQHKKIWANHYLTLLAKKSR